MRKIVTVARRQAILRRVRVQRVRAYKRTVADWMQEGLITKASAFKERSQRGESATRRS